MYSVDCMALFNRYEEQFGTCRMYRGGGSQCNLYLLEPIGDDGQGTYHNHKPNTFSIKSMNCYRNEKTPRNWKEKRTMTFDGHIDKN